MSRSRYGKEIHNKLIAKAAKKFESDGYDVVKEARLNRRNKIDALAIKGNKKIGLECQLTISEKILTNKVKNYSEFLDKMIFIVPKSREEKIERVIENISKTKKIAPAFFEIWSEDVDLSTTMRIRESTKTRFYKAATEMGQYGDTEDDIISMLLDLYEKHKRMKK